MMLVDGIAYCKTHGGILVEGTDYSVEANDCQYAENDDPGDCVEVPLWWAIAETETA